MTQQDRGRTKGQSPPKTGRPKARRVSQRKELVVVTLGMVAAVSGVSGLLATNPPLTADIQPVATARQTTAQQATNPQQAIVQQGAVRRSEERGGMRAAQEDAGQREAAGEAVRAGTARKEPEPSAWQEENEHRRAETVETNQASEERAFSSASASASASAAASGSTASASAVSQGS